MNEREENESIKKFLTKLLDENESNIPTYKEAKKEINSWELNDTEWELTSIIRTKKNTYQFF